MNTPTDSRAASDPTLGEIAPLSVQAGHALGNTDDGAVDPDHPWWGVLAGIGLTLATFFLMVVMQFVFLIPYVLLYKTPSLEVLSKIDTDKTAIFLSIISTIPAHLLTLALAWAIVTRFGKRPFWASLGWGWSPRLGLWRCLGLTALLLGAGQLFSAIFGDPETGLMKIIMSSNATRYAVAALATFTAPLVEEIVFRGVLYSALRKRFGVGWGATVVILIFAAIHVPQYLPNVAAISAILLLSSVLTLVRARTGKLLPCVAIHFFFNGITSVLIVFAPYLERVTPPSPAPTTPPAGALFAIVAHLFTLCS